MLPNPWVRRRAHRTPCTSAVLLVLFLTLLSSTCAETSCSAMGLWATVALTRVCSREMPIATEETNFTQSSMPGVLPCDGRALISRRRREEATTAGWSTRQPVKRWINLAIDRQWSDMARSSSSRRLGEFATMLRFGRRRGRKGAPLRENG